MGEVRGREYLRGNERSFVIMYPKRISLIVLLFLLSCIHAFGQDFPLRPYESVSDTQRRSTLQFDRTLNTFLWLGKLDIVRNMGSTQVELRQEAHSRLVRSDIKSIKDELNTHLDIRSNLQNDLKLRILGRSVLLSDTRAIDLSRLYQHTGLVGLQYPLKSQLDFSLMGGYELASQEGVRDNGFSYFGEVTGNQMMIEEFISSFVLRSGRSFLGNRTPSNDLISVNLQRNFGTMASNALTVNYSNQQRDFYTVADSSTGLEHSVSHNVFRRQARELSISNKLEYRPDHTSLFTARGGLFNRWISRGYSLKSYLNPQAVPLDVKIQEFSFFGIISFEKRFFHWLTSSLNISYDERDERHRVVDDPFIPSSIFEKQERSAKRLGNIASRTGVSSNVTADLSSNHRVQMVGSASMLRYDTPDSLNTDDRDELLITAGIMSRHILSPRRVLNPRVIVSFYGDVSLNHLVYLSRHQSANNNWNRILRFGTKVEYQASERIRNVSSAEVLANYTAYDYEEQVRSVRSYSFRQAQWSDSLTIRFGRKWDLSVMGHIRMYERGILKWKEFKERPENFFLEQTYWPQLIHRLSDAISFGVGYRYFSQDRYKYQGKERVWERGMVASGPTVAVTWNGNGEQHVEIRGWREHQIEGDRSLRKISNLSILVGMRI